MWLKWKPGLWPEEFLKHISQVGPRKGFHLLLGRNQVMRRASKEPVKPPGVTFLIQCSGTVVKDMQDGRRFRLALITGSNNSHSPPFLIERGGKTIRASSQDERQLPGR